MVHLWEPSVEVRERPLGGVVPTPTAEERHEGQVGEELVTGREQKERRPPGPTGSESR